MIGAGSAGGSAPSLLCLSWLAQAVPAILWAQIPSSAHLLTSATVTQAVGSAHASPMSKALVVIIVPPTFGTSPAAVAASLVTATQPGPEAPPAMRYGILEIPGYGESANCLPGTTFGRDSEPCCVCTLVHRAVPLSCRLWWEDLF